MSIVEDRLRLADDDRDRAAADLHRHHAEGRIGAEELEERLDAVGTARTRGDLEPIFEDLPATTRSRRRRRARGWHPVPFLPLVALLLVLSLVTGHPWVLLVPVVAAFLILRRARRVGAWCRVTSTS